MADHGPASPDRATPEMLVPVLASVTGKALKMGGTVERQLGRVIPARRVPSAHGPACAGPCHPFSSADHGLVGALGQFLRVRWASIHRQLHVVAAGVPPGARPRPIDRAIHQAAAYGVVVDVVDSLPGHTR